MIDLVLQNSCIPAGCANLSWRCGLIETFHPDRLRAWHHGSESRQTQTALGELDRLSIQFDDRIDDDVKGHRRPFAFRDCFGREVPDVVRLVLDDREPKPQANLWGGETHARRVTH